jgi:tryptophanase
LNILEINYWKNKIPLVLPIGGHAIYLDAKKFLEHLDQDYYPAQALSAEIFIEGGVRTMERGLFQQVETPLQVRIENQV